MSARKNKNRNMHERRNCRKTKRSATHAINSPGSKLIKKLHKEIFGTVESMEDMKTAISRYHAKKEADYVAYMKANHPRYAARKGL